MTDVKHQRRVVVKSLALISCAMLFALSIPAQAQQAKIPKIGWLTSRSASAARSQLTDLQRELRALGYLDGKNVTFELRYAGNKLDRLSVLADELVGLKVDVLIARSPPAALAAKKATRTIPIVFYDVADPVVLGLV